MCSGNGICKPKGCQCRGNWDGADCSICRFGYIGEDCEELALLPVDSINLCSVVMFEDLLDFEGDSLEVRWSIQDYMYRTTRVMKPRHYGTKFISPLITLGHHTHVRIQTGFFVMDMPKHEDSGIISKIARTRSSFPSRDRTLDERESENERVIFIKRIPYVTGINIVGTGRGDTSDQMDVTTSWEHSTMTVEFEIWSPDLQAPEKGEHRLTLTYFVVHSCTYPSQSGQSSADQVN